MVRLHATSRISRRPFRVSNPINWFITLWVCSCRLCQVWVWRLDPHHHWSKRKENRNFAVNYIHEAPLRSFLQWQLSNLHLEHGEIRHQVRILNLNWSAGHGLLQYCNEEAPQACGASGREDQRLDWTTSRCSQQSNCLWRKLERGEPED